MSLLYPQHEGCGGPLVPGAAVLERFEPTDPPLYCTTCSAHTWGSPGDLAQATRADAIVHAQTLPAEPSAPRARRGRGPRPGLVKTSPEVQLDLFPHHERTGA